MDVACDSACEVAVDSEMSGTAATDVGFVTPADSVTTGWATGGVETNAVDAGAVDAGGDDDGGPITAVSIVSELVGAILAGERSGAAAFCEGTTTGSLDGKGALVG